MALVVLDVLAIWIVASLVFSLTRVVVALTIDAIAARRRSRVV